MAHAHVVRSPHAHARIVRIDRTSAVAAPGVLVVLTGQDAAVEKLGGMKCQSLPDLAQGAHHHRPLRPVLATGVVRHVGDGVALIIAEKLSQAKDAGELLDIEYEPLPATTLPDALEPAAPKVWHEASSNVSFRLERGDRKAVEEAIAKAAHVTTLSLHYPRVAANTIEPRSAIAYQDAADGRHTICSTTQRPHQLREWVSDVTGVDELELRVVSGDVGGGFGMKAQIYPEEILVFWAAKRLGRPVKWTAERSEAFASDAHGRHQIAEAKLALDQDGRILALAVSAAVDLGAYLSFAAGVAANNASLCHSGPYVVPLIHTVVSAVFSNTTMMAPYRGTAKPEASFVMERLIDKAAREMGIDPVEMRRRNIIPSSAMPYKTASGYTYDSGEFEKVLDKALVLADWSGFPSRRAHSESNGLRRGIGLALHCQRAGNQSERMEIRVAKNGSLALHVGTHSHGQGHETAFAQMVSAWLGVSVDQVHLFQGDTDNVLYGRGTHSQRSMIAGGSALFAAANEVIRKGIRLASLMLEAGEQDIEFKNGVFCVKGTDRTVSFHDVVQKSYQGLGLPGEFGIGLDGTGTHPGPHTFPNGCMICEVEVDTETGVVNVVRLSAVDDVGTVINPLIVEGQLHGSTAQGLGEVLLEQILYDRTSGQLVTGSFTDYAMPRADNMPPIESDHHSVPAKTNPLGVKGGAEAGNVGAPAAIINAIIDALSAFSVTDMPIPATPERVWRAIHRSNAPA